MNYLFDNKFYIIGELEMDTNQNLIVRLNIEIMEPYEMKFIKLLSNDGYKSIHV